MNTNTDINMHVNSVDILHYTLGFVLVKFKSFLEFQQVCVHVICR